MILSNSIFELIAIVYFIILVPFILIFNAIVLLIKNLINKKIYKTSSIDTNTEIGNNINLSQSRKLIKLIYVTIASFVSGFIIFLLIWEMFFSKPSHSPGPIIIPDSFVPFMMSVTVIPALIIIYLKVFKR